MVLKAFVCAITLGVSLAGGCGEDRPTPCGTTLSDGFVFDAWGQCCHASQQTVRDREYTCDFTLPIVEAVKDGGTDAKLCENDQVAVCLSTDVPDGGDAGSDASTDDAGADAGNCTVVTNITVCPTSQVLVRNPDRCVDRDLPDGGTEDGGAQDGGDECPTLPDAGVCPAVACPSGQTYDQAANRCRDLVEACRYTCDAGKVLTDACQCVDFPAPCTSCPSGQLLNTASGECVLPSDPWSFPCDTGKLLNAANVCITPAECPGPCPDAQARDNMGTCVTMPVCLGPCPTGQTRDNGGNCVTSPSCPGPCPPGQSRNNEGVCAAPLICPGACPEGQARTNAGTCVILNAAWTFPCNAGQQLASDGTTCVTPPAAKVEASYQITPNMTARADVAPGQTDVTLGNVTLRVAGSDLPAEVTAIPILFWAADSASGPFSESISAGARAQDRFRNCWLKDWPPLTGAFGPVQPGSDGRLLFTGTFTVNQLRSFRHVCDIAPVPPNNGPDAFASDVVAQGGTAVTVNGSVRTAVPYTVGSRNGNVPLAGINVLCRYTVSRPNGTTVQVTTKPSFSSAPGAASGTVARTWVEVLRIREFADACGSLQQKNVSFALTLYGPGGDAIASDLAANQSANFRVTTGGNLQDVIGEVIGLSKTSNVMNEAVLFSDPNLLVPSGGSRDFSVWVNATRTAGVTGMQAVPGSTVSWSGVDNPSSYPASTTASDLAAAVGNLLTF